MPQAFGRYWLHEKIGHGGMAEIYRATIGPDPKTFAFELAVKRLHPDLEKDPKQVGAFLTEADVAKFLRHPNLVQVYESGIIDSHVYIAMEYMWGFDLARLIDTLRLRRILLPPELASYIVLQLLRGLDYVHLAKNARGQPLQIVHRDVTPSNIYVTFRGEVKLADFGVAQVAGREFGDAANVVRGKLRYMPPEVLAGGAISHRVDLWSLSVAFYEMLTARSLRENVADDVLLSGAYKQRVEPVRKINPAVPQALSNLLSRALHPNPGKRPQNATLFYRELKQCMALTQMAGDANALSRFVRAGTNAGAEPKVQTGSVNFDSPEYLAPIEFSPTQRYELYKRRGPLGRVFLMGLPALAALGLAVVGGYVLALKSQKPVLMSHFAGDTDYNAELGNVDVALQERLRVAVQKATSNLKRGNLDEARAAFHQALEIQPASAIAQLGLARTLYEQSDFDDAEKVAVFLARQEPNNPRVHYLIGNILRSKGELSRAKKAFAQCLALDPNGQFGKSAQEILSGL